MYCTLINCSLINNPQGEPFIITFKSDKSISDIIEEVMKTAASNTPFKGFEDMFIHTTGLFKQPYNSPRTLGSGLLRLYMTEVDDHNFPTVLHVRDIRVSNGSAMCTNHDENYFDINEIEAQMRWPFFQLQRV